MSVDDDGTGEEPPRRSSLPPLPPPARPAGRLAALATSPGGTEFVPPGETVHVDTRKHPVALAVPVLRTLAGLLVLVTGVELVPVLLLAGLTAVWAHDRLRRPWRSAGVVALVVVVLALWLGTRPATWALAAVLVLVWLVDDVLDWWSDRLVVTDKRVYRRYGWITQHAPSMALTNAVFIDVAISPFDRLLRCGTLRLDSAAQRDAPLAKFELVPGVRSVHSTVLTLRGRAARPLL